MGGTMEEGNVWEVRRDGVVLARSTLKYCGYTSLNVKIMREEGYEFYLNGRKVGK